jgi:type I restriction enzyme M protein
MDEIRARGYNLDIKNPYVDQLESYDPDILLSQYSALNGDIDNLRDKLKSVLGNALQGSS